LSPGLFALEEDIIVPGKQIISDMRHTVLGFRKRYFAIKSILPQVAVSLTKLVTAVLARPPGEGNRVQGAHFK